MLEPALALSKADSRQTGWQEQVRQRSSMENERFNMSLRKYLKHVGVTSQQEIERYVREHGMEGKGTKLKVKTVLTADGTDLHHEVDGEIDLS
jgi:hypothetical protein